MTIDCAFFGFLAADAEQRTSQAGKSLGRGCASASARTRRSSGVSVAVFGKAAEAAANSRRPTASTARARSSSTPGPATTAPNAMAYPSHRSSADPPRSAAASQARTHRQRPAEPSTSHARPRRPHPLLNADRRERKSAPLSSRAAGGSYSNLQLHKYLAAISEAAVALHARNTSLRRSQHGGLGSTCTTGTRGDQASSAQRPPRVVWQPGKRCASHHFPEARATAPRGILFSFNRDGWLSLLWLASVPTAGCANCARWQCLGRTWYPPNFVDAHCRSAVSSDLPTTSPTSRPSPPASGLAIGARPAARASMWVMHG